VGRRGENHSSEAFPAPSRTQLGGEGESNKTRLEPTEIIPTHRQPNGGQRKRIPSLSPLSPSKSSFISVCLLHLRVSPPSLPRNTSDSDWKCSRSIAVGVDECIEKWTLCDPLIVSETPIVVEGGSKQHYSSDTTDTLFLVHRE